VLAEGKVADATWPVALAAAPDGRLFYAELMTGNIRIWQDGNVLATPFAMIDDVSNHGESGLLGLALHPSFPQDPYVYALYVVDNPETGYALMQRVVRFRDVNNIGRERMTILDNLPATTTGLHNGGRIAFGPDGKLYISIGDTDVPNLSQDPTNLAGSILRFNEDGSIPADNPISGSPVFAIGLRNVFGLAFQPDTGNLYVTENGPGGFDEVNKIEAGGNYGWPEHMGVTETGGITDPIAVYGTWPQPAYGPTGATFAYERPDILLFCAYHVQALHALQLGGPEFKTVEQEMTLSNNCVLDATASTDGWIYYSTVHAIYRARIEYLLRLNEKKTQ
jgi:glucose/arabinose dehydrogenase